MTDEKLNALLSNPAFAERRQPQPDLMTEGALRAYNEQFKAYTVAVAPGAYAISDAEDEMLVTVLGSCVAACIRDPLTGVGGMNHFMLPGIPPNMWAGASDELRYGHYAMEKLINEILKLGGSKDRLEIKLFGGASILKSNFQIGEQNILFVKRYLQAEGFRIESEDLGGLYPRRVHYFPKTGRIFRLLMRRSDDAGIFNSEIALREKLRTGKIEGSVEIYRD